MLYRWRARAMYDTPLYPHSPWRRLLGQAIEADLYVMRPVTDRMKISREKLAFIIDATAAPLADVLDRLARQTGMEIVYDDESLRRAMAVLAGFGSLGIEGGLSAERPVLIDRFLEVFATYIDSGFGLLGGDVAFLATTLIVIDVTLAALFWAWGADDDIIARLVKKTLFVGVFAYIIGNWNTLARIVFDSFAGLGLVAVDDDTEGIDRFLVDQDLHLDQRLGGVAVHLVVEAGVALGYRFQPVVEIEHHLVQRQPVDHHGAAAGIGQVLLPPAPVLAKLQHRTEMLVRHEDGRLNPRLLDALEEPLQGLFPIWSFQHLHIESDQFDPGGQHLEGFDLAVDNNLIGPDIADQSVIKGLGQLSFIHPHTGGGIGLWIAVHQ